MEVVGRCAGLARLAGRVLGLRWQCSGHKLSILLRHRLNMDGAGGFVATNYPTIFGIG